MPRAGDKRRKEDEIDPSLEIADFPEELQRLRKVHQAITTISTFLATSRKHVVPTFELLAGSVKRDTGMEPTVEQLASIKYLMSDDVFFGYVDEHQIQQDAQLEVTDKGYRPSEQDVFDLERAQTPKQLLLFDFTDAGTLRPVPKRRRPKHIVETPTFPLSEIRNVINRRLEKFRKNLVEFVQLCRTNGDEPVAQLELLAKPFLPRECPALLDPVNEMLARAEVAVPRDKKAIADIIAEIKDSDFFVGQPVEGGEFEIPERPGEFHDYDSPGLSAFLSETLVDRCLKARGITSLYSHQLRALEAISAGKHLVVTTATSSGKSLIFQLPMLQALVDDLNSTSLCIFPTKALAQDQKRSIQSLLLAVDQLTGCVADTYDGDTPQDDRMSIRETASIIFTNPDMLHVNILPRWRDRNWVRFLRNLKYVVIDELHIYNGLFGSHVAMIIRRLFRLCENLGNTDARIVACSATIRNPRSLMEDMFGLDPDEIAVVDSDGCPMGKRHYLLWNTSYVSPTDPLSGRVPPAAEAVPLMLKLVSEGVRTIAFCKVRRTCEMLMRMIRAEVESNPRYDNELMSKIMAYRGGYSIEDRRRIEGEMFSGRLLGIVATNALELGIDIGNLDAVLIVGFPYSISNFRQQVGRAGRRLHDSLAILVGGGDPIDQYYMKNPQAILDQPNTEVCLALDNLLVMEGHLQCAAYELPIKPEDDMKYFAVEGQEDVFMEVVDSRLRELEEFPGMYACSPRFLPNPSDHVTIRGIQEDEVAIVDVTNGRNTVIETLEAERTNFTLYEGAIFLHQGLPYLVQKFHHAEKFAEIVRVNVDWTTRQRDFKDYDPIETEQLHVLRFDEPESRAPISCCFGKIKYTLKVFGYFKMDKHQRIFDAVQLENDPMILYSKGFWIDIPNDTLELLRSKTLSPAGAIHGAEHALLNLFSNFVMANFGDVVTECKAPQKEFSQRQSSRMRPARLIFMDRAIGSDGSGTGISKKAYQFANELIRQALDRVESCPCEYGCPECVASERCSEESAVLSKIGTIVILRTLAGRKIDADSLPSGPEPNLKGQVVHDSIVPATPVRRKVSSGPRPAI